MYPKPFAKGGQGRKDRFVRTEHLLEEKDQSVNGYVSEDDRIAGLFEVEGQGKDRLQVYYGNVVKVTGESEMTHKQVPKTRVRQTDPTGRFWYKWFQPVKVPRQSNSGQVKHTYQLPLLNPYGNTLNEIVKSENLLTVVRMTLDKENDCWELNPEDFEYAESQRKRYAEHHAPKKGRKSNLKEEWTKDVRKDHDSKKTKVSVELKRAAG